MSRIEIEWKWNEKMKTNESKINMKKKELFFTFHFVSIVPFHCVLFSICVQFRLFSIYMDFFLYCCAFFSYFCSLSISFQFLFMFFPLFFTWHKAMIEFDMESSTQYTHCVSRKWRWLFWFPFVLFFHHLFVVFDFVVLAHQSPLFGLL